MRILSCPKMTYECYLHAFKTDDPEVWDRHCYYNGHTNIVTTETGESVEEPYPRHHMRDYLRNALSFGPFSQDNPPSLALIKAIENEDAAMLLKLYNDQELKKNKHKRKKEEDKKKLGR